MLTLWTNYGSANCLIHFKELSRVWDPKAKCTIQAWMKICVCIKLLKVKTSVLRWP